MMSTRDWIALIISLLTLFFKVTKFFVERYQKKQERLESAKQSATQQLTNCIDMYVKAYDKKAPFFKQILEEYPARNFSNFCPIKVNKKFFEKHSSEFFNEAGGNEIRGSRAADRFIHETQPFIDAVLILEQQLNADERKKFYALVKVSSSEFIELFKMVNSLEDYTPVNKTAFDNAKTVFNALNNNNP
jgi:hypothetical protein